MGKLRSSLTSGLVNRQTREDMVAVRDQCLGARETYMHANDPLFTLIVPVFNEEDVLPDTASTLRGVLDGLGMRYEVLIVDNGSIDATPRIAAALCAAD